MFKGILAALAIIEAALNETEHHRCFKLTDQLRECTGLPYRVARGLVYDSHRFLALPDGKQEQMLDPGWWQKVENAIDACYNNLHRLVPAQFYSDDRFLSETMTSELPDFFCKDDLEIKQFIVKKGIIKIGESAFRHCCNLDRVVFEDREVPLEIGYAAFRQCEKLKRVQIANITRLGKLCFSESGLEEVEIDGNLAEIPARAFFGCKNLYTISLPWRIEIGDEAFKDCSALEEVKVQNSPFKYIGSIGREAFSGCKNLRTLSSAASRIEDKAFAGCEKLEALYLDDSPCEMSEDLINRCFVFPRIEFNSRLWEDTEFNSLLAATIPSMPIPGWMEEALDQLKDNPSTTETVNEKIDNNKEKQP